MLLNELVNQVITSHFGARALDRLLASQLEAPLLDQISEQTITQPRVFRLSHDHGSFHLKPARAPTTHGCLALKSINPTEWR